MVKGSSMKDFMGRYEDETRKKEEDRSGICYRGSGSRLVGSESEEAGQGPSGGRASRRTEGTRPQSPDGAGSPLQGGSGGFHSAARVRSRIGPLAGEQER